MSGWASGRASVDVLTRAGGGAIRAAKRSDCVLVFFGSFLDCKCNNTRLQLNTRSERLW